MENINSLINEIAQNGFDCAVAIATEAEVQSGAACGQMCLVTEEMNNQA